MGTTLMARLPMNLRGFTLERRRMARGLARPPGRWVWRRPAGDGRCPGSRVPGRPPWPLSG